MPENKTTLDYNESSDVEIDLFDLLQSWRQHLWVIVLVAIFCAAIGFAVTYFAITPEYEATSSIYVVSATANSALDLSDLNLGSSLTKDYEELVKSRTMLDKVIEASGDELTVGELREMLTVSNTSNTRILKFKITSTNPRQAMRLANAFADQAIAYLPEVMGIKDNTPTLVDAAIQPASPSNMNYMRNTAVGFLAGLVLILGIYTLQYIRNDTFDSSDDIEKYLGIIPIAMVPENGQKYRGNGYYYYSNSGKGGR